MDLFNRNCNFVIKIMILPLFLKLEFLGSYKFLLTEHDLSNYLTTAMVTPIEGTGTRAQYRHDLKCETPENPDFLRNGKMVISVKIRNFSRSRMMKRTSPLELSREI